MGHKRYLALVLVCVWVYEHVARHIYVSSFCKVLLMREPRFKAPGFIHTHILFAQMRQVREKLRGIS